MNQRPMNPDDQRNKDQDADEASGMSYPISSENENKKKKVGYSQL